MTLKQTNSIVGQHQEPQQNPPMSQITIVNNTTPPKPILKSLFSNLPNHLIMDIINIHTTNQQKEFAEFKLKFSKVINIMDDLFEVDPDYPVETPVNWLFEPGAYCYYLVDRPEQLV